ncbi:hypothetical protein H3H54_09305 [Brachybacterium sp. Z12]|uniref:hypothetical protein n=1 Tax=Brachybacterium sp. Z12 TaxID=2759167 RepID=UPI00185FCD59|nr:hypothetical protein [Brachybacterium sp. Z12]QNN81690.1 hypothetical protein H3H54_09305 [Brachybacterium sp. Z12]
MPPLDVAGAEYLPVEVYDAALAAAPVGEVVIAAPVMEESGRAGTVNVDYTVGDQAATAEFTVEDYDGDDVHTLTPNGDTTICPPTSRDWVPRSTAPRSPRAPTSICSPVPTRSPSAWRPLRRAARIR